MKKVLFGTTALLGGLLLAQSATAQTTVRVGGDVRFDGAWINDDRTNAGDVNFLQEFRLPISMDAVADNGLQYGALVRIRNTSTAGTGIHADRRFIYVGGDWGRIELGDEWGIGTKLEVMAPTIGIGQIDGTAGDFTDLGNYSFSHTNEYDRSTKIAYYTPRFSGFQAGVSFAPERGQQGDTAANRADTAGVYRNQIELGANYTGEFSGFGVRVGGGATFAEFKDDAAAPNGDDLRSWFAGAQVSVAGFTVGGGYFNDNEVWTRSGPTATPANTLIAPAGDRDGWNAGVTYSMGDLAVGASYGRVEVGSADDTLWSVGASYRVAPGLSANLDVYFFDVETAGANYAGGQNDGTAAVFRTQLTF